MCPLLFPFFLQLKEHFDLESSSQIHMVYGSKAEYTYLNCNTLLYSLNLMMTLTSTNGFGSRWGGKRGNECLFLASVYMLILSLDIVMFYYLNPSQWIWEELQGETQQET